MPRLRTSYPGEPGIARRRSADGFAYVDHRGRPVADAATLDRIAALAIPPAWEDVWISPYHNGHIQAAGTDAAGRRQYLYHEQWRERRDVGRRPHGERDGSGRRERVGHRRRVRPRGRPRETP